MVPFSPAQAPKKEDVERVVKWLLDKQVIKTQVTYADLVTNESKGLEFTYGETVAMRDVSFALPVGETLSLTLSVILVTFGLGDLSLGRIPQITRS